MKKNMIDPCQNHLLARLPSEVRERLFTELEQLELKAGDIVSEPNKVSRYVYFPIASTFALYYPMDHGISSEIALIGKEGMFSIVPVLGGKTLPYMAMVETPGFAYRMEWKTFKRELDRSSSLKDLILLYTQALFTQMAQLSICGRHHSLRQQLCFHLLLMHDRASADRFVLTQQTIAHMLGVRRESVTKASVELRENGFIDYRRGFLTVRNRNGLEGQCCECYNVVREEFYRLLG